jgi:hypothetical protein
VRIGIVLPLTGVGARIGATCVTGSGDGGEPSHRPGDAPVAVNLSGAAKPAQIFLERISHAAIFFIPIVMGAILLGIVEWTGPPAWPSPAFALC